MADASTLESPPISLSNARPRSKAKLALKLILVAGMLGVLGYKGLISLEKTKQALMDWEHFLPAIGVSFVALLLGILRWQWLLEAQDIRLPLLRTAQLSLIGNFFNVALPGAVSGDLVKAFYIGREVEGKRARAFGAILFDRVVGISALVMVSAGALLLGIAHFQGTPLVHGIRVLMILTVSGVIGFYAYLFVVRENHDPLLIVLKRFEGRFARMGSLTRIYEGVRHYHHHRATVAKALSISVVIHLLVGLSCYWFALALGEFPVELLAVYVVVPLGLVVSAIPIAPAGIGTGHAAFYFLFKLVGSEAGPDIYSLYAISMILFALLGGFVYFRFKGKVAAAPAG